MTDSRTADRQEFWARWARSQPFLLTRLIIYYSFIARPMCRPRLVPQSVVELLDCIAGAALDWETISVHPKGGAGQTF